MAGDTDKCQIRQMPPQPHHRCANLDAPLFCFFLLRSFVGKMETWSTNDKTKVLVSGQVGRMDVTTLNEQPAWRNGADMGYVLIMHRVWMHSDTQALAQAQFQHEQSFPHPYGQRGVTPIHCLSKQSWFSSRGANGSHMRADIWYWWWHDICGLMAH